MKRSTGLAFVTPKPPSICTASVETRMAVSVASSLAIAASLAKGLPSSFAVAARYLGRRAHRSRLDRSRVGPGTRLGDAEAGEGLPFAHRFEPPVLLLLSSVLQDAGHRGEVRGEHEHLR